MTMNQVLYLSRADVEATRVTMREVLDALLEAFAAKGRGEIEMPPKPGIHPAPDAFIHAMPAYIPALRSAGLKWVAGFPDNHRRGLPYISGLLILNDVETGLPLAIMDCIWVTAMRTGAATAVAAQFMARPESSTVGILACGVQGRTNLMALMELFPITRVHAFDVDKEAQTRYVAEAAEQYGVKVIGVGEPRQAVEGMDLIVTSGPILRVPHATIQPGWMQEGAFASLVDFDSYWAPAAMKEVDKFVTDDVPQLDHYRQVGYFQDIPPVYGDLGEIVAGLKPGRENPSERTMTCNLGLAMDDMATAPIIYRRALDMGIGTWLDL
jgi:ornithine cyclodeaminase/alanine dehydrogenase-like protein (mu-crystallin family)